MHYKLNLQYLGDKSSLLLIEMMRKTYMLAAIDLKRAREKQPINRTKDLFKFKVRDLLLLQNDKKQLWDTKCISNFHVHKASNDKAYDLESPTVYDRCSSASYIQLVIPVEYIVGMLPDVNAFGRACKYINTPCRRLVFSGTVHWF